MDTLTTKILNLLISYFRLFGLYLLFAICIIVLQSIFPYLDLTKYSPDSIFEILKNDKLKAFMAMVVFAPIIEEFMFRTLLKPSKNSILLFLSAWTLFVLGLFINLELAWYYSYLIFSVSFTFLFFSYKRIVTNRYLEKLIVFLNNHQTLVLQITSIVFGFLHIFNYVDSFTINSVLFLLIVPRIIAGHMFGKLIIKNEHIIWPILLHAINNGVVFIIISSRS